MVGKNKWCQKADVFHNGLECGTVNWYFGKLLFRVLLKKWKESYQLYYHIIIMRRWIMKFCTEYLMWDWKNIKQVMSSFPKTPLITITLSKKNRVHHYNLKTTSLWSNHNTKKWILNLSHKTGCRHPRSEIKWLTRLQYVNRLNQTKIWKISVLRRDLAYSFQNDPQMKLDEPYYL